MFWDGWNTLLITDVLAEIKRLLTTVQCSECKLLWITLVTGVRYISLEFRFRRIPCVLNLLNGCRGAIWDLEGKFGEGLCVVG